MWLIDCAPVMTNIPHPLIVLKEKLSAKERTGILHETFHSIDRLQHTPTSAEDRRCPRHLFHTLLINTTRVEWHPPLYFLSQMMKGLGEFWVILQECFTKMESFGNDGLLTCSILFIGRTLTFRYKWCVRIMKNVIGLLLITAEVNISFVKVTCNKRVIIKFSLQYFLLGWNYYLSKFEF